MTNQELIDHLRTFPPDAEVVYRCCSEYEILNVEQVKYSAGGLGQDVPRWCSPKMFVKRGGHVVTYRIDQWDPKEGVPEFVSLILFPGN